MKHRVSKSRRRFFRQMAAATVIARQGRAQTALGHFSKSANDRINLGFIGVGTIGADHLRAFLHMPEVQIVAVCDVVRERRDARQKLVDEHYAKQVKGGFKGCSVFTDFRELLARKDIDAVVIATPDHWHAIPCIHAARAGKEIYCEKPLTHSIGEGRKVIEAVRGNKIVFQTGSQQRSEFGGRFRKAVELVRNGRIGKIKRVRIGVGGPAQVCDLPEQTIPAGTDWNFWLGPAPKRGFHEKLCPKGVHKHFPEWRNYREYGGGGLADMGAHHFDIAQWALGMDNSGPIRVLPPAEPNADQGLKFIYANGIEMIHNVFEGPKADCVFEGDLGTILVSRSSIATKPEKILDEPFDANAFRVYPSSNHRRNWLECIRSRKDPICPPEIGHRSASICHLGNIGYRLRRPLTWDPSKEEFADDADANALISPPLREPWKI